MERLAAGAFVFFVLIVAADFSATASLAVAFAYLILISSLLVVGPAAFNHLSTLFAKGSAV